MKPTKNEQHTESDIDVFLQNLTSKDIDLYNKLSNMCDCEITEELSNYLQHDEKLQTQIEKYVIELAPKFKNFIVNESESLFAQELTDKLDYTSGLYNCDDLYTLAIIKAIGIITIPNN